MLSRCWVGVERCWDAEWTCEISSHRFGSVFSWSSSVSVQSKPLKTSNRPDIYLGVWYLHFFTGSFWLLFIFKMSDFYRISALRHLLSTYQHFRCMVSALFPLALAPSPMQITDEITLMMSKVTWWKMSILQLLGVLLALCKILRCYWAELIEFICNINKKCGTVLEESQKDLLQSAANFRYVLLAKKPRDTYPAYP
jgi:hypothetical protein